MRMNKWLIYVWIIMASLMLPGLVLSAQAQPRAKSVILKKQLKAVSGKIKKLPDLIVSNIELIKGCKIQITIRNIGAAGVPNSGYDLRKGVGIQMFKGGKAWGGIHLGAVDRSGRLKSPGSSVRIIWFPKAKNLTLGCGIHSIKVIVDNNHTVNEKNENNNSKTVRLQCKEGCEKKSKTMTPRKIPGKLTKATQRVPKQSKGVMVSSGQAYRLAVPDLVLNSFSVNQNAVQQVNNVFKFPFSVRIKNIGTGDVKNAYDLSFQTYNNGWGGRNQPGFNCKHINRQLKKDQSYLYSGTLNVLNYDISGQNLRIRAYVDSACSEEFSKSWGHVGESNENNNHSNEVTLSGGYHPNIGSLTPNFCVLGSDEVIMLGGMGFGNTQGTHTVILRKGNTKIAANITDWHNGVIYFKVPSGTAIGLNKVTIADATSLHRVSTVNEVSFDVLNTKILTWTRLIDVWDLFKESFKIELNTYGGGSKYQNTSKLTLLRSTDINVPLIQFNLAGLKYRFLVRDMDSKVGGIILTKQGCTSNQLKMEVSFESAGKELKGFNRALIKGAPWCDGCVADIHINNGKMIIIFNFTATNGRLNFGITTDFNASVSASNTFADGLMDLFLGNWNNDVKNQINNGVRAGLLNSENRDYIRSELENLIQMLLGLSNKHITNMIFKNDGIHVTYANP